ncbi:UNVERIFIED_CONTAM: hypothetical protein FKN15_052226 [Acipenser sinensis]
MKQAGGNRKPGNSSSGGPAAASGAGGSGGSGGRQNMGRGRSSGKGPPPATGTKCELKVKNGVIYEGVFKTYSPKCDLVLDAAHRKSPDVGLCPKREDILESIIFKASDVVVVQFKDVDLNYARKDTFTEPTVNARINGEHKDKDLEPWDSGENVIEDLEALETDVSNGWNPNDMFKFNEENYGVKSTYDSSLSSYTVALERDTSEEFLKREARAAQLADEIESSASYKARVAVENDDRTEEDKYTAVARNSEREGHSMNSRENKYIPPGQRNRDGMSWGTGRQNSPRMAQPGSGPPPPRTGAHNSDYSPSSGADQRVVNGGSAHRYHPCTDSGGARMNTRCPPKRVPSAARFFTLCRLTVQPPQSYSVGGQRSSGQLTGKPTGTGQTTGVAGVPWPSPCPSPSSRPPSRYQSAPTSLPPPAAPPPRPPSRPSRPPSRPSAHGAPAPFSTMPKRMSTEGAASVAPDHRQQIDNLKKFSEDFKLQPSSNPDPIFDQMMSQPRDPAEKSRESHLDKTAETSSKESASEDGSAPNTTGSSKPSSPSTSPSTECSSEQKRGPDVTSQGVQTSGPGNKLDKDDNKDTTPEQVRKSTLNPNAKEFNPRSFSAQPKPATTPTPPRPQGQPSPSIVVQQHPTMYSPTVCFPQMYPLPVSPGVQPTAMYHVPVTHMPVNQMKPYRAVPNMPQQRPDQHHPQGTPTMIHPATAAGPPIVAPNPAYSAQYVTYSPQQFANQTLVQQVPHYQSQPPHVYSPVMQSNGRMMAPPTHGQPGLVSSSTTQYGAAEQTHTMYVSQGPIPQQYTHPNATLHHHPQHPQPSATPTGQQQGQHAGSHPAPSPVQHAQHQAAQALHLGNPQQQPIYSTLTPTPPSMTPGPNPQSPQTSFPSAQQAVYIHPQQVQHGYNPSHMAHVPQAHVQSGMVPPHHATPTHPPMMLMATQPPGGPQPPIPPNALPPIPVSSTTHFSYMAHPTGKGTVWHASSTELPNSSPSGHLTSKVFVSTRT